MLQQIFDICNYSLNPYAIPVLFVALIFFFVSLKVLIQEELRVSLGFFLLGIAVTIWLISMFFVYCADNATVALWWARTAYIGVPLIPAALYHFVVAVSQTHQRHRISVWLAWTFAILFSTTIVSTDLFIGAVKKFGWGYYAQYKPLGLVFLLYAAGFQFLSLLRLVQAYQGSPAGSTNYFRNKALLIAFCIGSLSFVDYIPKFGVPLYPFGYLPILACIILVYRVIRRYRLVDITPRFASRAIINTMQDSLIVLDAEWIIRLVNKETVNLLGYAEQYLLGKHISALFKDVHFLDYVVAMCKGGEAGNLEISYDHPNGLTYIIEIASSVMKDEHGHHLASVFISRDVTHIKQTEAELIGARDELELRVEERSSELRKANEQLLQEKALSETIIDSLPGIFYICDEQGNLLRWNSNEVDVPGYSQDEIMQMNVLQLFRNDRELVLSKMAEVFQTGQAAAEASLITKSGASIPFYLTGFRMIVKNKRHFVGVGVNISERIRLEQQLNQAQKMEAVGVLAGGVAHDFNNILSAIVGYATVMNLKMDRQDPLRHNVDQILLSAERAASLVKSLLSFSRKGPINLHVLDINDAVSRFNNILARLIGEDIELHLYLSEKSLPVKADQGQIEQMLMNLVTNSRDAMPRGGELTIATDAVTLQEDNGEIKKGSYAVIAVTDTGTGMDEKQQKHIFEPFYTTKEVGKGTGLGLAIVYAIMKKHDGVITVESRPDTGTTFTLYLPLIQAAANEAPVTDTMPQMQGTETILLVEDDAPVRRITRTILEEYGYCVLEAVDGEDALRVFQENCDAIHLVLCDLIMPRKNGKETYDELVKIRPHIKIIFTSGYTADILTQKGLQLDGIHFISKPLNPTILLTKIREILDS